MFSPIRSTSPAQADALALQRRLIRLFDAALPGWPSFTRDDHGSLFGSWIPPVDVFEDKDSVRIAVERAKPRQIQVTVESK